MNTDVMTPATAPLISRGVIIMAQPRRSRVVLPQNTLPQQQTRKPITSRSDTGIVQSATLRLLPQASTRPKPPEDRTPARRIGDASPNHRGPTYPPSRRQSRRPPHP